MDALLILAGLGLVILGLVWLVLIAFAKHFAWGVISLLPPLNLLFVLRHWSLAAKAVLVLGLGVVSFVVGMVMLATNDPQRFSEIIALKWLPSAEQPQSVAIRLNGELYGEPFRPVYGELINGVLTLREGQDFFAHRELSISLPARFAETMLIDVLPDESQDLPEIEISWLLPEQDLPEALRLNRGYTMHLQLAPKSPNLLVGDLHLSLPPRFKTRLNGKLQVYRDGLRYQDAKVDRQHDSADTLTFVVRDYLQRRFATRDVKIEHVPQVSLPATALVLEVEASVDGQLQKLPLKLLKDASRGWLVEGDRYAQLPAPVLPVAVVPETVAEEPQQVVANSRPVDRRLRFSMHRLLGNPAQYRNLAMRVHLLRGGKAEGRFQGLSPEGLIEIRRNIKGAGGVSFSFNPDEIESVELLEP